MKLGLKIRYNESFTLRDFKPQMLELHLADRDIDRHERKIIDRFSVISNTPIVIHTQQFINIPMGKPPLVDLASRNEKQRKLSVEVVRRTMELAGQIEADHVVVHPGGIVPKLLPKKKPFVNNLILSLKKLEEDYDTRELLMENMPWFYWMWGGEELWSSMIMVQPDEFKPILEYVNVVLDICHAYLSRSSGTNDGIFRFLNQLGNRIKHVHLSDAAAPDKEGLQFGEGEIELGKVFREIEDSSITAIPEIKGGHEQGMKGFIEAFRRYNHILKGEENWD